MLQETWTAAHSALLTTEARAIQCHGPLAIEQNARRGVVVKAAAKTCLFGGPFVSEPNSRPGGVRSEVRKQGRSVVRRWGLFVQPRRAGDGPSAGLYAAGAEKAPTRSTRRWLAGPRSDLGGQATARWPPEPARVGGRAGLTRPPPALGCGSVAVRGSIREGGLSLRSSFFPAHRCGANTRQPV